jgi:hypothetical protein
VSVVVDTFAAPWTPDASGLWTVASTSAGAHYGADGLGMEISAAVGAAAAPAPHAEKHFVAPLDLRDQTELRFWLRSSRPGDGSPAQPVYLRIVATTDPPGGGPPWQRLVPVTRADTWQLVVLWLEDMPAALRQAVGFLRLESLDGRIAFRAAVDDLIATTPEPVTNTDAALFDRLDGTWSVEVAGVQTPVPAVLDLPEGPPLPKAPYILVTPWSVRSPGNAAGEVDMVDNPTAAGAFVRPSPSVVELVYRIDVWAQNRTQKSFLLDRIVADLLGPVVIDDVAYHAEPYTPADTERAALVPPGRTPLFVRLLLPVETGTRALRPLAVPLVLVGDISNRSDAEATSP